MRIVFKTAPVLDRILFNPFIFDGPWLHLFCSFQTRPTCQCELKSTGCLQSPAIFQHATNQRFTPTPERWNACEQKESKGVERGCGGEMQKWGHRKKAASQFYPRTEAPRRHPLLLCKRSVPHTQQCSKTFTVVRSSTTTRAGLIFKLQHEL